MEDISSNKTVDSFEIMMILASLGLDEYIDTDKVKAIWSYRHKNNPQYSYKGIKKQKPYIGPYMMIDYKIGRDESGLDLFDKIRENIYFIDWYTLLSEGVRMVFKYPPELINNSNEDTEDEQTSQAQNA